MSADSATQSPVTQNARVRVGDINPMSHYNGLIYTGLICWRVASDVQDNIGSWIELVIRLLVVLGLVCALWWIFTRYIYFYGKSQAEVDAQMPLTAKAAAIWFGVTSAAAFATGFLIVRADVHPVFAIAAPMMFIMLCNRLLKIATSPKAEAGSPRSR